jgi:ribose transport system substrate-binding protein
LNSRNLERKQQKSLTFNIGYAIIPSIPNNDLEKSSKARQLTTFVRRQRIIDLLLQQEEVKVTELAHQFGVSEGTIRNDLRSLEESGQVMRVHGGAVANDKLSAQGRNPAFAARLGVNAAAKERLARWASELVEEGDSIILDASSTTHYMTPYLAKVRDLTVITNGIETALALAKNPGHTVILVGGVVRSDGFAVSGLLSERILKDMHVRTAFLSASGFSVEGGMTEVSLEDARLKSKLAQCADRTVALIDSSKFGHKELAPSLPSRAISHFFTDSEVSLSDQEVLRSVFPSVTVCGENTVSSYLPEAREAPHYRIGFANLSEEMPFAVDVRRGLERAALEAGNIDLVVADNQLRADAALIAADRMLAKGVDLIIEFQIDEGINGMLSDKFKQAGIPVIAVDIPLIGATFFGVNNHQAGSMAGRALGQWIKDHWQGRFDHLIVLEEPRTAGVPAARILGQLVGMQEMLGKIPESKITRVDSGNTTATCQPEVARVLADLPGAQRIAIASFNDDTALGALYATREAGREGQVVIVGQGADKLGREEIRRPQSRFIGSTAYRPEKYGEGLIPLALDILNGKNVPPAVYVDHVYIDADNINQYYPE